VVSWKLNNDDIEVERIAPSVPIVNYRGRDPQHLRWLNDFSEMASAWATLHWRGRCATLTVMWAGYAFMRQDEYEQAYELFEAASQGEARLLALDAALDSLCTDQSYHNHIDLPLDEIGGQLWHPFILPIGGSPVDHHITSLG